MDFKISSAPVAGVSRYSEVSKKNPTNVKMIQETDKLDVSMSSRLFTQALRAAQEAPEVRSEKVEALRTQVQNGTYKVDSKAVADKMLSSIR